MPVIRIGTTEPAPFLLKNGSSAFKKNDLTPVVVCESFASIRKVPRKSSASVFNRQLLCSDYRCSRGASDTVLGIIGGYFRAAVS